MLRMSAGIGADPRLYAVHSQVAFVMPSGRLAVLSTRLSTFLALEHHHSFAITTLFDTEAHE